eukprot:1325611-Prymnesium_polylepis.1
MHLRPSAGPCRGHLVTLLRIDVRATWRAHQRRYGGHAGRNRNRLRHAALSRCTAARRSFCLRSWRPR